MAIDGADSVDKALNLVCHSHVLRRAEYSTWIDSEWKLTNIITITKIVIMITIIIHNDHYSNNSHNHNHNNNRTNDKSNDDDIFYNVMI